MKKSFAFTLAALLSAALLVFSLVIGLTFSALFRQHTLAVARESLNREAGIILSALSAEDEIAFPAQPLNQSPKQGMGQGRRRMAGSRGFLHSLNQITGINAWVVDENMQLITAAGQLTYDDLPSGAEDVVKQVFTGQRVYSEGFSEVAGTPSLTLGMPVDIGGITQGALLVHAPIAGMEQSNRQGLQMLLSSLLVGLTLSLGITFWLSRRITAPIKSLKETTVEIARGDYGIQTGIQREDEVGSLAKAIDTLSEKLKDAREESQQAETLRREFMANVSHELKTPVTVLRGSLEALKDDVVTEPRQVKQYYYTMLSETHALEQLIADQLELSKLQSPEFSLSLSEWDMRDLVQEALQGARRMAPGTAIIHDILPPAPLLVKADYSRLRQMLMVVLSNALHYGGQNARVTVTLNNNQLSIKDNGPGIPEKDLPHLFDRFYRGENARAGKEGSGLGLAIAKQVADRHNIQIKINSLPGEGTEFVFYIGSILI